MTVKNILELLYSGFYVLLTGAFVLLGVLSFREEVPAEARDPPILRPFQKMAVFIYRRFCEYRRRRRQNGKDVFLPGEEAVRTDLAVLYPSLKAKRQEVLYRIRRTQGLLLLLAGGILLAGGMHFSALLSRHLQQDGTVLRAPSGGEDVRIRVTAQPQAVPETEGAPETVAEEMPETGAEGASGTVAEEVPETGAEGAQKTVSEEMPETGTDSEYGTYTVTVHARQLTRREAASRAEEILAQFPASLLGENPDASDIRYPLTMPAAGFAEPFSLRWESSRYAVMDEDGSIFNNEYADSRAEEVDFTAILTYADYQFEKKMTFTVRAPVRDEKDILRGKIEEELRKAEQGSITEESFRLPSSAGDLSFSWREEREDASAGVLVLAAAAFLLAWYAMDSRLHEQTKVRSRQLAIDYPQFTGRLVLYLGAGMSVRNVFYKCAAEYSEKRRGGTAGTGQGRKPKGASPKRYLYEEILLVCNELDSGVPEAEAYMHFGRRCRSRQYTKLCSLLVQNLRRGNDTLLAILQEEARSSFEERKNLARELGEEAGTKLLFPMMIMLGVTMLIIIVPAYFSFSM
ncbi:MAG: type II secretion system F family protein [Eubacteriales bacterium]|nr:type II secretion system F family protein [Eubacteriales bacterium]